MKLKDILPPTPLKQIMVRTNDPLNKNYDGILFGYVSWDGEKLISLDGDNYYLEEEITRWTWENDGSLTYWIHSDWETEKGVIFRNEKY